MVYRRFRGRQPALEEATKRGACERRTSSPFAIHAAPLELLRGRSVEETGRRGCHLRPPRRARESHGQRAALLAEEAASFSRCPGQPDPSASGRTQRAVLLQLGRQTVYVVDAANRGQCALRRLRAIEIDDHFKGVRCRRPCERLLQRRIQQGAESSPPPPCRRAGLASATELRAATASRGNTGMLPRTRR